MSRNLSGKCGRVTVSPASPRTCLAGLGLLVVCRGPCADRGGFLPGQGETVSGPIIPDFVHVLFDGRIVRTGNKQLALDLEEKGYDWIVKGEPVAA